MSDYTPTTEEVRTGHPRRCTYESCERTVHGRGLCEMHYARARRANALPPKATPEELFWARVEKTSTCWLWSGHVATNGYGRVKFNGISQPAHRVAYELTKGAVPEGLELDHVKALGCESRACVNPAHLEPVTHRENTLRGNTITARCATVTHCPRGHELAEGNLVPSSLKRGRRDCLTCSRQRAKERRNDMRTR